MKKFLILFLVCLAQNLFSQNNGNKKPKDDLRDNLENYKKEEIIADENQIYNTAGLEILPDFPGGYEAFQKFLNSNFIPPREKPELKGKVYTTFIIEKDGSISDINIIKDLGFGTKEEAIRVLKLSPKWNPGKQNDKLVRVLFSAPIFVNTPIK